ncbi:general substrate transporter [Dichotomocladium elegans]|nr:general substrate transporter [Dichotomocladium elegans]
MLSNFFFKKKTHKRYDTGALTACLAMPEYRRIFSLDSDAYGTAAVIASSSASFLASLVSGFVADGVGRKKFFYIASFFHIIGVIVQLTNTDFAALVIGRIITGSTVGMMSMSVPLYQSEVASSQNRGRIITLYQLGVTTGVCVASWIAYGTTLISGSLSWRIPVGIQIVPGALLLLGLSFIPESPRWLIARGRYEEALEILAAIRSHGDRENLEVMMEYHIIVQDVSFDRAYSSKKSFAIFRRGIDNYLKRTVLGAGIHIFTQLTGVNAILFYLPRILKSAGLSEIHAALIGGGVAGIVNMLGTIPVFFFVDRWPRRQILIIGACFMAAFMIIVASLMCKYSIMDRPAEIRLNPTSTVDGIGIDINNPRVTYTIITLLVVFIAVFALSWGPAGWIYPAEIYPQLIRANAMGVTTATSYFFNVIITLVAPLLFETIRWGTYLLFGIFCVLMAITVHTFYPETRGRSLEEVNLIFSGALIDERAGAHHPDTAAEAISTLQQIQPHDQQKKQWSFLAMLRSSSLHMNNGFPLKTDAENGNG